MTMLHWILIGIVLVAFGIATAGTAEAIDMKAWDNQINNRGRFKVLNDFGGAAVLDKETQLVWEQAPTALTPIWISALSICSSEAVGGRKGWRLPTVQELASLIDPTIVPPGPTLPPGHPFDNVQSSFYWSATTVAINTAFARAVNFEDGLVGFGDKADPAHVWCVRGGQGVDAQ